ncbi:unnamed protein product [Mycena citricolor]|uniref:Uncharacterized protein n=1 Tax=Mycena citricolor TaxID=2018698 RepID=A0AAD2HLB4_9AGAR|nr:unnamed protein product [Mycena citricolor]CAK5278634.1 unnamed protein product [Mycena citricolor]
MSERPEVFSDQSDQEPRQVKTLVTRSSLYKMSEMRRSLGANSPSEGSFRSSLTPAMVSSVYDGGLYTQVWCGALERT